MDDSLFTLLDRLNSAPPQSSQTWQEWQIRPVAGGANNLLYQATSVHGDYAIKFTIRDKRDRAGREYAALAALQQAGLALAPQPIWLDRTSYRQPVVVQSWLEGAVLTAPPQTEADWQALLDHYCTLHAVTPEQTTVALADAVLNVASGAAGKALLEQDLARLPLEARPRSLQTVVARFAAWSPPTWPSPPRALCRVDANWRNFIRRSHAWASVDWENSGWGDPAFELADLMTHPAYEGVPPERWQSLLHTYADQRADPDAVVRIETYYTIMLVWWVVRIARYLYETPRGLDPRLATPAANWASDAQQRYERFVERAEAHLSIPTNLTTPPAPRHSPPA